MNYSHRAWFYVVSPFGKLNATLASLVHTAAIGIAVITGGCAATPVAPRTVAELPGYSEGIVFDADGAAYASTLHRQAVWIMRGSSPPVSWYSTIDPNGHKILADGSHLIAAKGGIHHVDATGTLIEVLAPQLATPNDLALDGDGGVYVSVPAVTGQEREAKQSGVFYIDSSRAVHQVASEFCYPNGIVVRPDGKTLLVNDSCTRKIFEFQITSPGVIADRRVLAELPDPKSVPDGMTIDRTGRLYMADYGTGDVVVLDHAGKVLRRYPTGLQHPSNVAFGGSDLTDLYVTGARRDEDGLGQLIVLPLGVRGRSNLTLPASILPR